MIKIEHIETYGWEAAIRGMYSTKCVRRISHNAYEAYISMHGKFISCGTFPSEKEARKAVVLAKIKLFRASVIAQGDNPDEIVESAEKGYFASPHGNIYNRHGEIMVGAVDHCGYRHIIANRRNRNVHRIVAETFIPNPNNLPCVNHKDGNKLNNSVDNLEWCTHSENVIHAYSTGLEQRTCDERHHTHKLTNEDVKYIRKVYIKRDKKFGAVALSKQFAVDRTTIHDIVSEKTWREVS